MGMALVYHETQQFVRLVQIMPLDHTIWRFLAPMQRSGAPLPRATLVQRCTSDQVCAVRHAPVRQSTCGGLDTGTQPAIRRLMQHLWCRLCCALWRTTPGQRPPQAPARSYRQPSLPC